MPKSRLWESVPADQADVVLQDCELVTLYPFPKVSRFTGADLKAEAGR
jgi:hypothetical protein